MSEAASEVEKKPSSVRKPASPSSEAPSGHDSAPNPTISIATTNNKKKTWPPTASDGAGDSPIRETSNLPRTGSARSVRPPEPKRSAAQSVLSPTAKNPSPMGTPLVARQPDPVKSGTPSLLPAKGPKSGTPSIIPPTPKSPFLPGGSSMQPGGSPMQPSSPLVAQVSRQPSFLPGPAKNTPPVSRAPSQTNLAATVAAPAPGSHPPPSRQGSLRSQRNGPALSESGLAAVEPQMVMSQAGSVAGDSASAHNDRASERRGGADIVSETMSVVRDLIDLPASQPPSEDAYCRPPSRPRAPSPGPDDELAGVDWRLTASTTNKELAKAQMLLSTEKQKNADLREENGHLHQRIVELEDAHMMGKPEDEASGATAAPSTSKLRGMLNARDRKIRDLEDQLRHAHGGDDTSSHAGGGGGGGGGGKKRDAAVIRELRQQLAAAQAARHAGSEGSHGGSGADGLKRALQARDAEVQELRVAVQQLENKLVSAQEAIVSATDYGWENDIKLSQARRALVSILDHHSPARARASPPAAENVSPARLGRSHEQDRLFALEQRRKERAQLVDALNTLEDAKRRAVSAEDYAEAQRLHSELLAIR
eukprot:gene571-861_t